MTQFHLFDPDASKRARDKALDAVDGGASLLWREEALRAGIQAAGELLTITSDDIAERMESWARTRDNRAMGPVLLKLARQKVIEPTERFIATRRISSHGSPRRIWRSLVHHGPFWMV
jgi:hypothetical protein